ncbi:hypothetical protein [Pararhizobium sp. O133]|uniref:hypothetical protein n=1 Tax=Pararhizobium sp. O133 TaxID=3449278 RepID=UPI003F6883FA
MFLGSDIHFAAAAETGAALSVRLPSAIRQRRASAGKMRSRSASIPPARMCFRPNRRYP